MSESMMMDWLDSAVREQEADYQDKIREAKERDEKELAEWAQSRMESLKF